MRPDWRRFAPSGLRRRKRSHPSLRRDAPAFDEHEAILDALQSGDEILTRAAMRDHLQNGQTRYRSMRRTLH
ncbi:FCD domain-containing protein [Ensifer sp. NPDC090286]|uniref:FCD domain-containing protein n=1 Tax=Ensifer sp. NPDC090286 TaxID=3363991 RepID=UPI00383BE1CB